MICCLKFYFDFQQQNLPFVPSWSANGGVLIPTRSFITKFKTHHTDEKKEEEDCDYDAAYQCPLSVFFCTGTEDPELSIVLNTPNDEELVEDPYTLEILPEEEKFVSIEASCDNLLFCLAREENDNVTSKYICNPFTAKWLLLPPPKRRCYTPRGESVFSGLVCEPNCPRWDVEAQEYEPRFRVLQFTRMSEHDAYMVVYCSETGQWNEHLLSGSQYNSFLNVVAYNGKLHWYNNKDVVAYDPFNDGQTIFIDGSDVVLARTRSDHWINRSECLGVCQGFLQYMQSEYVTIGSGDDNLSVWELKDYESRRMILVRKIFFNNMIFKDPDLCHVSVASLSPFTPKAAAFHPNNKDVVCLFVFRAFILCNIQSGELDIVYHSPHQDEEYSYYNFFPIALPWWPTPISTIPSNAHP